ncbi:MAG TPA: hypothetical protein VLB84_04640 [Bacteroidia bacterium]|nr:hypothetical protein [Bacteroidia bacterium]
MNAKKYRAFLLSAFLISMISAFSQDLIVQKNGNKIFCVITQEDSISLHYTTLKDNPPISDMINKEDVLHFFYGKKMTSPAVTLLRKKINDSLYSEKKVLIHFNMSCGMSLPIRKYKGFQELNDSMCFANKGFIVTLSTSLKLHTYYGVSIAYSYQKNNFDSDKYSFFLQKEYKGINFSSSGTSWKINNFVGGPYFTFPFGAHKKLALDLMVLPGVSFCTAPQINITATLISPYSTPSEYRTYHEITTRAFVMCVNVGMRYKVFKNVYVTAAADYFKSKASFSGALVSGNYLDYYWTRHFFAALTNFNREIESIGLKAGLLFTLQKPSH